MQITNLATDVEGLSSNAYYVTGERPALVDVGAGFDIIQAIETVQDETGSAAPELVVLTHTHPDHIGTMSSILHEYDPVIYGYTAEAHFIDESLDDGDRIQLGDDEFEVLYTPGHAEDHICLYAADSGHLFTGDVVFPDGGVGRTDLPGGDFEQLVSSIQRLDSYIDTPLTALYPGHGRTVTEHPQSHIQQALQTLEQVG